MTPERTLSADDWRAHRSDFTGDNFGRNLQVVERLKKYADARGITLPQLAVAWTISHPAVQVAIVGARRASHLDETVRAVDIPLSAQDRRDLDGILSDAVPMTGPSPEGMP